MLAQPILPSPAAPELPRGKLARLGRGACRAAVGLLAGGLAAACLAGPPADTTRPGQPPAPGQSHNTPAVNAALALYATGQLAQAERGFSALARQGDALARYNLAMMHLRGEVARPRPAQALRWLAQSAQGGFVQAMFAMGAALEQGVAGPRDVERAQDWYQQAAERGHMDAQVALGTAYYLGRGRPHDAPQAAHWYREAAVQGDVGAQYLLASMYEHGEGLPQDLRLARYWYEKAASQGDEAAPGKLRELDAGLSPL